MTKVKNKIVAIAVAAFIIFVAIFYGCSIRPTVISGMYFDTYISVTIYDKCEDEVAEHVLAMCHNYDEILSEGNDNSDISKLNCGGGSIKVNKETAELIKMSLIFARETDGIIDPTIRSVSKLWDFASDNQTIPAASQVDKAIECVDYSDVDVDGDRVGLSKETELTLGFIAKGYIADEIAKYLKHAGINNAIINLGGNVLCMGSKDGKCFNVGVEEPFHYDNVLFTIYGNDISVVTSGVYERGFFKNGVLYHHILNTKTGYPVHNYIDGNEIYAVTVTGPSSMICDALSTSLLALGLDKGREYISEYPEYGAVYIDSKNNIYQVGNIENIKKMQ